MTKTSISTLLLLLIIAASCASPNSKLKKGECIERPFGIYTYKIEKVKEKTIDVTKLNVRSKKIISLSMKEKLARVSCPE